MESLTANKTALAGFREALYNFDAGRLASVAGELFAPDCLIQMAFPIGNVTDPKALVDDVYQPLAAAIPDLERRDYIVISGEANREQWVGCAGYYTGVFEKPWLDIPPSFQQITLRFHEFYRFEQNRVVEVQSVWDIPELMMQAHVWPMTPSLGLEWHVPGPSTQDGLTQDPDDAERAKASLKLVNHMLSGLQEHASGGPQAMRLEQYWHPKMNWYGPSGIGTNRQIRGFRLFHQIPFLKALPDREILDGPKIFFAEGDYVGITAWPGMRMKVTGDGWLGIVPPDKEITMRSLDFWRCEDGLIRENWVLIDLLHVYDQLGVDVFERMRERIPGRNWASFR